MNMTWQFTPIAFMYLLAGMINLFSAGINWQRRNTHTGLTTLSLVLFTAGIWLAGWFFELSVVEVDAKQIFLTFEDSFGVALYILLLFFVLDYFELWQWFSRRWRNSLWAMMAINGVIAWTNPLHGLFVSGYTPGPPESNITYFTHSPLFEILNLFFTSLVAVSFLLLCYKSIISRGRERKIALLVTAALAAPFYTYLLFLLLPDQFSGLLAMPFGFSLAALLIDWVIVEDFRDLIGEDTNRLELSINNLRSEISKRERLEQSLRHAQDSLSMQLASQSSKLSGLYDLILISSQTLTRTDLLMTSLKKITSVLYCRSTLYYQVDSNRMLHLDNFNGMVPAPDEYLQALSSDWLPMTSDVRAVQFSNPGPDIPSALKRQGCEAALYKWVIVHEHPLGVLAAFWEDEHPFPVEEIALFGALTDGLGLILENARLRQAMTNEATITERRRLARDLHDSVTQSLHSLVLNSQTAMEENTSPERLKRILKRLDTSARQALKEMRLLLFELRLVSLEETGLVELLTNRLEAVERRAGIHADLVIEPDAAWPRESEVQLYPLAIEALNNSLKHARANYVSVRLSGAGNNLLMEIQDDGVGFDPQAVQPGGMGLITMAERCQNLGARFEIIAKPAGGTTIRVKMMKRHTGSFKPVPTETAHG
jgi:signal transduction histidine kinase